MKALAPSAAEIFGPDANPAGVLPFTTPQEIARMTESRPVFYAPYIAKGSITEIDAYAKRGKTSFVLYAVGCIVHNTACLGLPTIQTGVVYLTEERRATLRRALERTGLLDAPRLQILSRWDLAPAVAAAWAAVVDSAVETCKATDSHVLVIDTLPQWAGLRGDSENNAGDALNALEPLQRAAAAGLAVVITRHDRKGGGAVGESGRGSSAFAGAVDTIVSLRKPEGRSALNQRQLDAVSRFDEVPESLVIERTSDGGFSHPSMGLRFDENLYRALGDPGQLATEHAEQVLQKTIRESPGLTVVDLKTLHPEIKPATLTRALDWLRGRRDIDRRGAGKKGDPHVYFHTCPSSSQTSIPYQREEMNRAEVQA